MPTSTHLAKQLTDRSDRTIDLTAAAATISATVTAVAATRIPEGALAGAEAGEVLNALVLLRWVQGELAEIEPVLIAAARRAGVSWQSLAPALGVASRQAAERRYLRLVPAATDAADSTGDQRVRAERDRRAGHRAVGRWANEHTADLRQLAGQITGLTDLDTAAGAVIDRLHQALADTDASALPTLLTDTHPHLHHHPDLAAQVDSVTAQTAQIRHHTQHDRDTTP